MRKFFQTIFLLLMVANTFARQTGMQQLDTATQQNTGYEQDEDVQLTDTAETADILSDTSLYIFPINISSDSVDNWKRRKEFDYMKNLDSLLKRQQQQDVSNLSTETEAVTDSFLQRLLSSSMVQVLLWCIAAVFVFIMLYRLFSLDAVFRQQPAEAAIVEPSAHTGKVTVAEYDKLIMQACRLGDYRMAVRYLFLKSLSALEQNECLVLSADKTNYQYVQEIDNGLKNDFSALVLIYDYIWYGGIVPEKAMYSGIEKKFIAFHQKMTR